jgi:ribosomal protein S18 acetylase RimI-like enzyme
MRKKLNICQSNLQQNNKSSDVNKDSDAKAIGLAPQGQGQGWSKSCLQEILKAMQHHWKTYTG